MENIKEINTENCTYQFFNDMINIKDFDSSLIKIDKNHRRILVPTILVTSQKNL